MTVLLIDGHNVAVRCLRARADMTTTTGIETGALHLTITSMANYVKMTRPDKVMVCWDSPGGSTWRKAYFPGYKANRNEQKPEDGTDPERAHLLAVSRFLQLANVQQIALDGWEADDLVAAYWHAAGDEHVHIASGDKDFYQLLNSRTHIWHPGDKNPWTVERFIEEKGFEPRHMRSVMALIGDKIDGIPGVPRVGQKTAVAMLESIDWNLGQLIETGRFEGCRGVGPKDIPVGTILRNLKLVDLTKVQLPDLPPLQPFEPTSPSRQNWNWLVRFLDTFELHVIKARLEAGKLWTDPGWMPKISRPEHREEGNRLWAF